MRPGANRPSVTSRMLNVLVAIATAFGALVASAPPTPVRAAPVLGGQLFSTGEAIEIEVLPASAGLTSTLFLLEPEEVQIATNRDVGTVVVVGPYGVGEELVFGIRVSGQEYRMGPAVRNPDGIEHATVDFQPDGCAIVGFEDLFGGGDRDYDDNRFQFCGGIASEPPDPEEPPAPPPFVGPNADAGDDQSVPEGSVVTLDATRSTASNLVTRIYTTTSDFSEGTSINLSDVPPDQLQLDDTTEAFAFIWIAASARGTVVKIDTATGDVLGEYWSAPQNRAKDPSRTTVDHNGNVWVGNRAEASGVAGVAKGSVTQVGLAENGQCVDRNANGVIDTSSGLGDIKAWPNASGADTNGGVETATDECIINYVRTNGVAIRQVSVDADNHVWVGGAALGGSPNFFDRLAPDGSIVRTINMRSSADTGEPGVIQCCYGGLVDPNGVLWSSADLNNYLVRIDPSKPNGHADLVQRVLLGRTSYGLGIDPDGFLWQTNWTANTVQKISPAGALIGTFPTGGPGNDRGVAVTADGDVWVANSGGSSVSRLRSNGSFVTQIAVGSQPTGVAVDAAGKVWASNLSSSTASRIDPATNAVDLTVSLGSGAAPYNYSDMTGSTLTGAPDTGTWSVVYDSEEPDTVWAFVDWASQLSGDAGVAVTVASSTDGTTFTPEVAVTDGEAIEGLADGRYLRVTARFTRSTDGDSPVLFDLTVAHEGDRANALAYRWNLVDFDGPPIFLSSATSPTPSFVAPDDATYTFEVTVTDSAGQTDTDEVTVTVDNLAPQLAVESTQGVAGSLTLVSASFTDAGWLDTHTGSIDWGDGTTSDLHVTDGTGWGTTFGSHLYAEPGSYSVALILTDDDGGTSTAATATVEVAEAVAIWANSETVSDTLDWPGSGIEVTGRVHSNRDVKLGGSNNAVDGSFEYVNSFTNGGTGNAFAPAPALVSAEPYPVTFALADYQPGGRAAVAAGDQYFDLTSQCASSSKFEVNLQGTWLDEGLYYAPCDVVFNASNVVGTFTVVSTAKVEVSGSSDSLAQPFIDGLLFFTTHDGNDAMKIAGSNSGYSGFLVAPDGRIEISGSESRFFCGILADRVALTGSNNDIDGGGCAQPAEDTGGTLLVPSLALSLAADVTDALPSDPIAYDLTVSNDGASLVVSGLVGAENVDDIAWTVDDFAWSLETFDVATGAWSEQVGVTPAGSSDGMSFSIQPNPAPQVAYGTEPFVGSALAAGGFASWSYEAVITLEPDEVNDLLDPGVTGGIRVRFDLDFGNPSARVRQIFRFGNDFIEPLRALSGAITDASLTLLLPTGDPVLVDSATLPALASLAPGASAEVSETYTVEVPAPRGTNETDAGYLSRLLNLDGSPLVAASFALASGGVGQLVAPLVTATTTERLPVVSISTLGPDTIPAGNPADFDLKLANLGSADAPEVGVSATAADDDLTVADAPSSLEAGQLATATTTYSPPETNPPADVTVRGAVTWSDAAGNDYGPVGSARTAQILTPATLSATLVDTLHTDVEGDGQVSPGDTVRYRLTVTNHGGQGLDNVSAALAPDANSALVVGSVSAPDGAVVSGNGGGDTSVQVSFASVGGDSSASFTFEVTVDDPFPTGVSRIETQGTVSADGFDDVLTDDPSLPGVANPTRTTVVVPVPNLTAFLSGRLHLDPDGNGFPSAGDTLRYELTVNSVGSLAVSGIGLTVPVPSTASLVAGSVTTSHGTVNSGPSVSVDVGALASFTTATIGFDLLLASPLPAGTTALSVQGSVSSAELDDLLTDDPNTFTIGDPTVIGVGTGTGGGGGTPGVPGPEIGEIVPAEGTVITEPTDVSTSLTPPPGETVTGWTVSYRLDGESGTTDIASGSGTAVAATVDPTVMPNGSYVLIISASGSAGGISAAETSVIVEGNLKLGRFQVTYQDLNVPVGGIPLQVLRTYDSFDKTVGDFGVGWRMELANFRVSTNGPLGAGGWTMFGCGGGLIFVPLCFETSRPHYVAVTWPDGLVETFDLTPARGSTFLSGLTSARFTARAGTTSTLDALDSGLYFSNGDLLGGFFGSGGMYDPTRFRLTDRLGTQYVLEVGGGLLSATDRNGNTVTVSDDGISSSSGPAITFTRDASGRITEISGPTGGTRSYSYDDAGNLIGAADELDNETTFQYDDARFPNYLTNAVDPLGIPTIRNVFDGNGRLIATCSAGGDVATLEGCSRSAFDVVGRLWTTFTPKGLRVDHILDERGNILLEREWVDDVAHFDTVRTYDDNDNLLTETDPSGSRWTFTYDARGNLLSRVDPMGRRTQLLTYNDRSQVLTDCDALGRCVVNTYDAAGNRRFVEDRGGGVTEYQYNEFGQPIAVIQADGSEWTHEYDDIGYPSRLVDPAGNAQQFEYDVTGLLRTYIDREGRRIDLEYDETGRVTSETWDTAPETVITYEYDAGGNLVSLVDPDSTITMTYRSRGELASIETGVTGFEPSVLVTLDYDLNGNLALVEDSLGGVTEYTYDLRDFIVGVEQSGSAVDEKRVALEYDQAGNLTDVTRFALIDANAHVARTTVSYDCGSCDLSVDGIEHRLADGTLISGLAFDRDAVGNVIEVVDAEGQHAYAYDALNRIVSVDHPSAGSAVDESYDYDAVGNRLSSHLSSAYTYAPGSRLIQDDAFDYSYDRDGNLVNIRERGTDSETAFVYDHRHRMVKAVLLESGTTVAEVDYIYDAANRLVQRVAGPEIEVYVHDPLNRIVSMDGSGSISERRLNLPLIDETLAIETDGETNWLLGDHVGTVNDVVGDDGSVLAHYEYDSFGRVLSEAGAGDLDVRFQSREFDEVTGLGYFRARHYDPGVGRFVSEDPLEPFGYDFAANNPLVFVDPFGESTIGEYVITIKSRVFVIALHGGHHHWTVLGKTIFCVHLQLMTWIAGQKGSNWTARIPLPWCRGASFPRF